MKGTVPENRFSRRSLNKQSDVLVMEKDMYYHAEVKRRGYVQVVHIFQPFRNRRNISLEIIIPDRTGKEAVRMYMSWDGQEDRVWVQINQSCSVRVQFVQVLESPYLLSQSAV